MVAFNEVQHDVAVIQFSMLVALLQSDMGHHGMIWRQPASFS